jgi:exonuclease SbcC
MRDGEKGGNPRAMLSAGNLNTAALTLFLALHLSVKPELPWLIIDDPVQSMDEVHISQFAALLRTLSKRENRQIMIAVHERALFDYLALELSPAYASDRLITVELGRAADGNTIATWEIKTYEPDKAIAA